MKVWIEKAIELLACSLEPPRHELNELDWKAAISPDKQRLKEHLCAFANYPGGGVMVYGIDPTGVPQGIEAEEVEKARGSGLFKAGMEVELYGLPPIEFDAGNNYFKVTLHTPRTFAQMSAKERLEACYQHAVLKHYSDSTMTNTSLRERLKMPERQRSMVSLLIQEAIDAGRIKPADPESTSRKYAEYVPAWA